MAGVIPMLAYEDGVGALEWLCNAFGFRERARIVEGGVLTHAELEADGGTIYIASPTPDYQSPIHHRESCAQAAKWSASPWVIDGVMVHVADIESHFQHAKNSGASILTEIEEGFPGRRYRAEDCEGHRWMFMQPM